MPAMNAKKLIVVAGPTAVGKTAVAIQLAKRLGVEIVSADSRQLFVEMNIGTSKPSHAERAAVKHHFVDCLSITTPYDAGKFGGDALHLIAKLFEQYDQVILCGGSGLYIRAVCEGFDDMPDVPGIIREELVGQYKSRGIAWLQQQLSAADPDYFEQVDLENPHRLMRALELIRVTGEPVSALRKKNKITHPFSIIKIGLDMERQQLYDRIDQRVDGMMQAGLLEEARGLYAQKSLLALHTVGYQELFRYLEGVFELEEAVRLIKRNTRRYAKRQLTWFRKEGMLWFRPDEIERMLDLINPER